MPSLEKPCLLLPHGCERSTVYMCVPVDAELAATSSVLETLVEFEGFVEMPDGVSVEDFEVWATTAKQDPTQLTLEELSIGLQVGDKLSAANTSKLAETLAEKMKAPLWATCRTQIEPMLRAVLLLSKDVQQLVFGQVGQISAPQLFQWPLALQQVYSDMWATRTHGSSSQKFSIADDSPESSVLGYLSLLSRTDPALPGLTSLSVHAPIATPAAASCLCSTLLHHPSLASLDLPRLCWAPSDMSSPAATVVRMLPTLTTLTALTLSAVGLSRYSSVADAEAAAETVQDIAAAVSALPQIAQFHLRTIHSAPASTRTSRSRRSHASAMPARSSKRCKLAKHMGPGGATAAAPLTLDPVMEALSTAPALTSLTLSVISSGSLQPLPCRGVRGPFAKLQLLRYCISEECDGSSLYYGVNISTAERTDLDLLQGDPLPALQSLYFTQPATEASPDSVQRMFAIAASQPALRRADVRLPVELEGPASADGEDADRVVCDVCGDESLRHLPGVWCHCCGSGTQLRVSVAAAATVAPDTAKQLLARFASLARTAGPSLSLRVYDGVAEQMLEDATDVAHVLQPLTALKHLKHLDVGCIETGQRNRWVKLKGSQAEAVWDVFATAPLRFFASLTCLRLYLSESVLQLPALAEQLSGMTQLQRLTLEDLKHDSVQQLTSCFATLTTLTSLSVDIRPVTADVVRAFASMVVDMPELRSFWLTSVDATPVGSLGAYASVDWLQGLLNLPCRGRYEFYCGNTLTPGREMEAVQRELEQRGARVQIRDDAFSWTVAFSDPVEADSDDAM